MIVAMVAMYVVEMAVHQIVDMVSVGNGFVTTARPMDMAGVVTAAAVRRCAGIWVCGRDGNEVLIGVAIVGVMEVPVMQIVDVPIMHNGLVATTGAMHVVV